MTETTKYRGCTIRLVPDDDGEAFDPRQDCNLGKMLCAHRNYLLGDLDYVSRPIELKVGGKFQRNDDGTYKMTTRQEGRNALPTDLDIGGDPSCANCGRRIALDDGVTWYHEDNNETWCEANPDGNHDWHYGLDDQATPESGWWPSWEAYLVAEHDMVPDSPLLPLWLLDHSGLSMSTGKSCPWDSGQVGWIFATNAGVAECGTPPELFEEVLRGEVETYSSWLEGDVWEYVAESPDGEVLGSCGGYVGWEDNEAHMLAEAKATIDCYLGGMDRLVSKWAGLAGLVVTG